MREMTPRRRAFARRVCVSASSKLLLMQTRDAPSTRAERDSKSIVSRNHGETSLVVVSTCAACRVPRATCRVPRATYRMPHAACRVPRAACRGAWAAARGAQSAERGTWSAERGPRWRRRRRGSAKGRCRRRSRSARARRRRGHGSARARPRRVEIWGAERGVRSAGRAPQWRSHAKCSDVACKVPRRRSRAVQRSRQRWTTGWRQRGPSLWQKKKPTPTMAAAAPRPPPPPRAHSQAATHSRPRRVDRARCRSRAAWRQRWPPG